MTDRVPELNFNNKNYYGKYLPSMYIRLSSGGETNSEATHAVDAALRPLGPENCLFPLQASSPTPANSEGMRADEGHGTTGTSRMKNGIQPSLVLFLLSSLSGKDKEWEGVLRPT